MAIFSLSIKACFILMLAFHLSSGTQEINIAKNLEPQCSQQPTFGCNRKYMPVCASDGITYGNLCMFCRSNRVSMGKITYKHDGPCSTDP